MAFLVEWMFSFLEFGMWILGFIYLALYGAYLGIEWLTPKKRKERADAKQAIIDRKKEEIATAASVGITVEGLLAFRQYLDESYHRRIAAVRAARPGVTILSTPEYQELHKQATAEAEAWFEPLRSYYSVNKE